MNRCVGCQWRTPKEFGGQGIICLQKDGKCPEWVIKWTLSYLLGTKNPTEEQLLEANRL